jgi:hypothetical protein
MSPPELPPTAAPLEVDPVCGISPIAEVRAYIAEAELEALEARIAKYRALGCEPPPALEALARHARRRE